MRGKFVVFEGLDRSGKSTQAELLKKALIDRGQRAILLRFPDRGTTIGKQIDAYLKNKNKLPDEAIHLLFSANRWELASTIEAALADGVHCIVDRYSFSGVAFSAAKGMDWDWCKQPERGLPSPDIVLFFQVDPNIASKRAGFGNERYELPVFQRTVAEKYALLRQEFVKERKNDDSWLMIDGNQSIEQVHLKILTIFGSLHVQAETFHF
ncbi:thymidylate kinase Tmp1 [Schizosaccharomyces japonicus yFS275]|uniref:Thymidylate kinase n=1 Tax=Schizosaccharomyces japonicus (strain yFS275 / FY16936) TaxID=402676 RepID=B6K7E8_SCHJY|nr:thymidylate kinase Tmp1 [Schizosaccharomyces japonicus yFS275]EEB09452.1 thymidylate kinase Tmp1 [Schizosaccharomyces japonicus yFS275]